MSNLHLRVLDGGKRRGQADADDVRRLAERDQAGDLDPGGLELAAFLGHGPAAALAPHVKRHDPNDESDRQSALLSSWGSLWVLAGDVALSSTWTALEGWPPEVRAALDCAIAFVARPSQEAFEAARRRLDALTPEQYQLGEVQGSFREIQAPDRSGTPRWKLGVTWLGGYTWAQPALEAVIARALVSPSDPLGPWMTEARWLEERRDAGLMSANDLEVLHACGHRPASIALGLGPPATPPSVVSWIERLFELGRGTEVGFAALEVASLDVRLNRSQRCLLLLLEDRENHGMSEESRARMIEYYLSRRQRRGRRPQPSDRQGALLRCLALARLGQRKLLPMDLLPLAKGKEPWSYRRMLAGRLMRTALAGSTRALFGR